jgi:EAL domain-containing protein (putative c-di-GMP-specific phosphodiesterase class I)
MELRTGGDAGGWSERVDDGRADVCSRHAVMAYRAGQVDIDEALRQRWLEIWYQPKIDLKRKCLAGAEALARIRHPELGVLLPDRFLPAGSEESLTRLTEHALLATLRNWTIFDEAGFNLHLAINLPASVLLHLPISAIVEEHRPQAEHWPGLILEVTEDEIVRDLALAQNVATQLKISGVTVAIDDFGAGYSSLSSLRDLPFAELKIDHSFVKNCGVDPTNAAICQTAIDLAHRFGSAAVAEGIEHNADLQALQLMGCDFGQGVLLAPPMPMDSFLDLLRQRLNLPSRPAVVSAKAAPESAASGINRVA